MVLSGLYVIPHGDEIIDNPSEGSAIIRKKIEHAAAGDSSDSIVIISPHGLRLRSKISVINTERLISRYSTAGYHIDQEFRTDRGLARSIADTMPDATEEVQFITSEGELSAFPVDFGTSVPLYFFGGRKVVSMGQTRTSDRISLVRFGKELAGIISSASQNVSIIISADQAHTHWSGGPYGYSDSAVGYDKMVVDAINGSDFSGLMELSDEFIEQAKPDSYWNMLILSGILEATGRSLKVGHYYVERYFGMLIAV